MPSDDRASQKPIWKREIRFSLSGLAIAALLATVAYIGAFIVFEKQRPILVFTLAVLGTSAGLISAYYVGQSIREGAQEAATATAASQRSEKFDRAMALTSRWNDPGLRPARKAFREVLDEHHGKPEDERRRAIRQKIEEDDEVEMSLIACMNLLEDLALAVHEGMVDEYTVIRFYGTTVEWCWETLEPWVRQVRDRRGPRIYVELENLYNSWHGPGEARSRSDR